MRLKTVDPSEFGCQPPECVRKSFEPWVQRIDIHYHIVGCVAQTDTDLRVHQSPRPAIAAPVETRRSRRRKLIAVQAESEAHSQPAERRVLAIHLFSGGPFDHFSGKVKRAVEFAAQSKNRTYLRNRAAIADSAGGRNIG